MKISLNWLKELVDLPWPADALPEKLASLGFPVESVEKKGVSATGVIAVKILAVDKHPNADRLRIAKVTDGSGERSIVCGAPNIEPGQTVPLATPGAKLPGGIEITISKIRGVESGGMLCSERELGLSEEHAGILMLPEGTKLGSDVAAALGGSDTIFDVEVTPNRPDILSHVGLARDLAALAKTRLKLPDDALAGGKDGSFDIEISEPSLCARYLGRVLSGVKVGPSPDWMVKRLTACGIRAINNVVDVTNYVQLEWGHPLHAFDIARLKGPVIRVRKAKAGEKFQALDEKTYALNESDLVIADKDAAVAIAGIMGGQHSGVTDATTDILLESAVFDRAAVRQTSRRLGLKSESSFRFEKGTDADTAERAWKRAAKLLADLAGAKSAGAKDAFPSRPKPVTIELRRDRLASLLGMSVPDATVQDVLERLDFAPKAAKAGWTCAVPPHRKDVVEEADLVEEVIRLVGYNAVPATLSRFRVAKMDSTYRAAPTTRLVQTLRGYGVSEALSSSLVPSEWPAKFGVAEKDIIKLANPISQEESALRPTLAINLLRAVQRNLNHQRDTVALFEIGKTFWGTEEAKFGLVLCGRAVHKTWRSAEKDVCVFYLKGLLEALARDTQAPFTIEPGSTAPFLHPHQSFTLQYRGRPAGWAGMLNPRLAAELDLGGNCAIAEIDLAVFTQPVDRKVTSLPKHAFVERDIAVVIDKSRTTWSQLKSEAEKSAGPLLVDIFPFDIYPPDELAGKSALSYREEGETPNNRSVAFRIRLQDPAKTLSESDINAAVDRIKASLQKNCGAQLR